MISEPVFYPLQVESGWKRTCSAGSIVLLLLEMAVMVLRWAVAGGSMAAPERSKSFSILAPIPLSAKGSPL